MSELSQDARALIEEVCSLDAPREADRDRVRGKLMAALGVQAFVAASAGTTQVATTTLSSARAGANEGALAKLSNASWWSKGAMLASAAGVSAAIYLAAAPGAPPAPRDARSLARSAQPMQVASPEAPVPTVTAMPSVSAEPLEATAAEPSRGSTARHGAKSSRSAHRRIAEPAVASAAAEEAEAPAQTESTLAAELALLTRAERALREGNPREALRLATEYRERFAAGSLGEERDGVEALARCMLGDDGRSGAREFLERAPSSPLAPRVRKECGLR